MTEPLGRLLERSADAAPGFRVDVPSLVAAADRRQRRRRLAAGGACLAVAAAVAVGALAVRGTGRPVPEPAPAPSPAPTVAVDPAASRPLVYAEGTTVHVGDATVTAEDPVAFIDVTDDGVVYESSLDGTLWFTDGTSTAVIGHSGPAAAPTLHLGTVTTGDTGSLVVWRDRDGRRAGPLTVYDTSLREVVGRIPVGVEDWTVLFVSEDEVYLDPHSTRLRRFDVATGHTTTVTPAGLEAAMARHTRMLLQAPADTVERPLHTPGTSFVQVGHRLVPADADLDPRPVTTLAGDALRLRLPAGYSAPSLATGGSVIRMSQWLDDDHVAVWATAGGGDLPPQTSDLLVCRVPDGLCRVEVARSAGDYVAPWRG
ncbi:hypothetical protein J2X46_001790 [Nocardioides sp. BE266]|uniref:hypothetical protein n=1 Tax=Nocardioides sp. BE266 TaxID=2817725 RepID=UPI00285536C9|nr:hypothetical protein [Nocardioides sp. BE266]MDR7252805.1 hypothetical protein [Nocardioides sp. BE266]